MNSGMLRWISVLPTTYFLSEFSIVKERQISTQDFWPRGRFLLRQRHGYTHFIALMETQADSRRINLHSKKSKSFNFFCSLSSLFFVHLMRIGKLSFKNQRLHSLNLEVLQRISNIRNRFFPFSRGKSFICAKVLNWNLPLYAIFLFSYCP